MDDFQNAIAYLVADELAFFANIEANIYMIMIHVIEKLRVLITKRYTCRPTLKTVEVAMTLIYLKGLPLI